MMEFNKKYRRMQTKIDELKKKDEHVKNENN